MSETTVPPGGPRPPLPEPLRAREKGTFTYDSVVQRLPDIAQRMLAENEFAAGVVAELETLIEEIPHGKIRSLAASVAPDAADWDHYVDDFLGQDWLQVPWFFAETYFYRRILEATGFFQPGPGQGSDPFAYQKRQGLDLARDGIRDLSVRVEDLLAEDGWNREMLASLIALDLWGNQADLSMWPAGHGEKPDHAGLADREAHTLVDDAAAVADYYFRQGNRALRVDFILDNAGFELVSDLCLAACLLGNSQETTVQLHVKAHPTFVSDATMTDVRQTVVSLAADDHRDVAALGRRLATFLETGRLRLQVHNFWTSPLAMWEMPDSLHRELGGSDLLISKGDANYRRLLGDRHWPHNTPFAEIVSYLPAPLVALRTLKSEVAAGLQPGQAEAIARQDPEWLVNGRWGVIQFFGKRERGSGTGDQGMGEFY